MAKETLLGRRASLASALRLAEKKKKKGEHIVVKGEKIILLPKKGFSSKGLSALRRR